jgi:hypothetical protein
MGLVSYSLLPMAVYTVLFTPSVTIKEHLWDARARVHFFSGLDENVCNEVTKRLVQVVVDTFKDERIKYVTFALASILWERRHLSGEEVLNVINASWGRINQDK